MHERLYSKAKHTNKMVFRVELLILQNMYYFLELKFSLCWKTNRSYFSMALYTLRSCLYANGFTVFFHYKQKERNQYKSIKSIVIITRIIISLQSFIQWKWMAYYCAILLKTCVLRVETMNIYIYIYNSYQTKNLF